VQQVAADLLRSLGRPFDLVVVVIDKKFESTFSIDGTAPISDYTSGRASKVWAAMLTKSGESVDCHSTTLWVPNE